MLVEIKGDQNKIEEYNKHLQDVYINNKKLYNKYKIKNIEDRFVAYNKFIEGISKNIKIIPDTSVIKNIYVSGLNSEYKINDLTNFRVIDSFKSKYGVCDNASQVLEYIEDSINNGGILKDKKYIAIMTPIFKKNQPEWGGWRWHKWGKYIGVQERQNEYLYEEEDIDLVYCFEIFEVE